MSNSGGSDWVGTIVGGVLCLALIICGSAFAFDRLQATFMPKQHAAAQAQQAAEQAAESSRSAEEEKARAAKEQADLEEAQAYATAKEAVQSVRNGLADPDGALFKDVWAVRGTIADAPEGVFACGTVNAKNGFGGYVGYTPFVAVGSTVLTPQDGIFERVFRQVCLGGEKLFPIEV